MNFVFVLGAPKSGTTALSKFLNSHPLIELSDPKEPHYFDADLEQDFNKYLSSHFSITDDDVLKCDATPSYLMVPWAAERIKAKIPDAKLVVCLRNPVERAFSSWWMLYSRGMENLEFEEAIEAEKTDFFKGDRAHEVWRRQVRAIRKVEKLPVRTYLEAGCYAKHLKRLFTLFPRENIHIVWSSELYHDRDSVMDGLREFLNLSIPFDMSNQNNQISNAASGAYGWMVFWIARKLGLLRLRGFLSAKSIERVKSLLAKSGKAPKISSEQYRKLNVYFKSKNKELEALLGVDLSSWR